MAQSETSSWMNEEQKKELETYKERIEIEFCLSQNFYNEDVVDLIDKFISQAK